MEPILAQATCAPEAMVCGWLDDTGLPDWLVVPLTRVVQPILSALVILVVTAILASLLKRLVRRVGIGFGGKAPSNHMGELGWVTPDPRRERRIESLTEIAESIVVFVVWVIGVGMAIGTFGVNLGPLIASAGIAGVALGFGAQSLVRDFLSGVFMLAEDQFGIGDVIDIGEAVGVVEDITLRTTSVRGVDGTLWFVPNGEIQRVGNMSQDWARALLDVSVAYGADVDNAIEVIASTARTFAADPDNADLVLEEPEILGIEDLGADAVVVRLWIKTKPGEQWALTRELRRRIKLALDEADIAIPFPQRTVWLRHQPDDDALARAMAGGTIEPDDQPESDDHPEP